MSKQLRKFQESETTLKELLIVRYDKNTWICRFCFVSYLFAFKKIQTKKSGRNSIAVAKLLNFIGVVCTECGKFEDGNIRTTYSSRIRILSSLMCWFIAADSFLNESLKIKETAGDKDVAVTLSNLAGLADLRGDFGKAKGSSIIHLIVYLV